MQARCSPQPCVRALAPSHPTLHITHHPPLSRHRHRHRAPLPPPHAASPPAPPPPPPPPTPTPTNPPTTARPRPPVPTPPPPWQQRVLNTILATSAVPYSSFVARPITPLHRIDARVKQLWLLTIFVVIARSAPPMRFFIAAATATLTMLNFPRRLWASQLQRLGLLCTAIFVLTAIGSDSVPPLLQPRSPPPSLDGLLPVPPLDNHYSYVVLHVWFITITRRSINLAITAATLTFTALQGASLCLVTTPGEEMAMGLRWFLQPLRLFRVRVNQVALTLLLSLRFMSLVFEEVRNLCLGLASRGVDWKTQGSSGTLYIFGKLFVKLFANLFQRADNIAAAMVVRGFRGPDAHRFHCMRVNPISPLANAAALAALAALCYSVTLVR